MDGKINEIIIAYGSIFFDKIRSIDAVAPIPLRTIVRETTIRQLTDTEEDVKLKCALRF
jgi:hypothetical protein